jgi:hypothetical protein
MLSRIQAGAMLGDDDASGVARPKPMPPEAVAA